MMNLFKAELRKLFTVRSTYFVLGAILVLEIIFAAIIGGYKATPANLAAPDWLASQALSAVSATAVLTGLIALLLFAHEYRYNLIGYTLTVARSRSKVLAAKILATTVFVIPVTFLIGLISVAFTIWGIDLHGLHLVPQTIHYADLIWRCLFFGWAYAMFALVFVALIRNQVGSIVALFIIPGTVESIAGLLLKDNVKYLPFTSLGNVVSTMPTPSTTPVRSAITAGIYLVAAWAIGWVAFLRRDAN